MNECEVVMYPYAFYPCSFFAGQPGQVIGDAIEWAPQWQSDFWGNAFFAGYRPVHVLTVSRGPWMAPYQTTAY